MTTLASFAQLLFVRTISNAPRERRHWRVQPKPFAQSIYNPVYVRLHVQLQDAHALTLLTSLVPYDRVVLLIFVQLYADGNRFACPPLGPAGSVGAGEGAHYVGITVAYGVFGLAFFVEFN